MVLSIKLIEIMKLFLYRIKFLLILNAKPGINCSYDLEMEFNAKSGINRTIMRHGIPKYWEKIRKYLPNNREIAGGPDWCDYR